VKPFHSYFIFINKEQDNFFYKERKTKNQTLKRYQAVEINQDKNVIAAEN